MTRSAADRRPGGERGANRFALAFVLLLAACVPAETGEGRDGYLTGAGGAEIYYDVMGEGADTVIVVHGGPGAGMNSVRPDFEPLADELTLIFYDQRGGGRSELPADTSLLRAPYFIDDLDSVRAHFGLERMKLLAHSFGSVLVARYAREHPERVERIVLHGATGPVRDRAARLARMVPPSPDTALSRRAGELLGSLLDGTAEDPAETCREWEAIGRRLAEASGEPARWKSSTCDAPPEAVGYYYEYTAQLVPRTFGAWDFTTGLEGVSAPVLVVYANHDSLAVAEQRAWVEAFPDARLLLVPGTAKGAIAQRPEAVVPAIVEFFASGE